MSCLPTRHAVPCALCTPHVHPCTSIELLQLGCTQRAIKDLCPPTLYALALAPSHHLVLAGQAGRQDLLLPENGAGHPHPQVQLPVEDSEVDTMQYEYTTTSGEGRGWGLR